MSNKGEEKRYGLIPAPRKTQLSAPKPGNIFGDNDDSDEDTGTDWVKKALQGANEKNKIKKQTKMDIEKALKEDPTIYQYDEVYDDIEQNKMEIKETKSKEAKKPKYIHNLLKTAERRKIEQEHRIERMVQKEREAEGEEFADKESFVTSSYRAKLEEFKKLEEEEKRMERLESIADVTKQADMTGFYRHLYRQKVERTQLGETEKDKTKEEGDKVKKNPVSSCLDKDEPLSSTSKEEESKLNFIKSKRQYRKRVSDSDSEPEKNNEDGDDNDIVNDSSEGEDEPEEKKQKLTEKETEEEDLKKDSNTEEQKDTTNDTPKKSENVEDPDVAVEKKEKIDPEKRRELLFSKRCIGTLYDDALQRYYERKAERLSANLVF